VLFSVDFWIDETLEEHGMCYCQHDCLCMASIDDDTVTTLTLDSLNALPAPCNDDQDDQEQDESSPQTLLWD
jgi:hypothetical protein